MRFPLCECAGKVKACTAVTGSACLDCTRRGAELHSYVGSLPACPRTHPCHDHTCTAVHTQQLSKPAQHKRILLHPLLLQRSASELTIGAHMTQFSAASMGCQQCCPSAAVYLPHTARTQPTAGAHILNQNDSTSSLSPLYMVLSADTNCEKLIQPLLLSSMAV